MKEIEDDKINEVLVVDVIKRFNEIIILVSN
jgi:hypothetical protein